MITITSGRLASLHASDSVYRADLRNPVRRRRSGHPATTSPGAHAYSERDDPEKLPRGGDCLHVSSSAFHFRKRPRLSVSAWLGSAPRLSPGVPFLVRRTRPATATDFTSNVYPFPFRFFCAPSVSPHQSPALVPRSRFSGDRCPRRLISHHTPAIKSVNKGGRRRIVQVHVLFMSIIYIIVIIILS